MNGEQKKPRLILLGGFLGSGKTTLMVELGKRLADQGRTVGVITNDQGELLVDTAFAASAGLAAGEVQNGCFCCNFTTFVSNIDRIVREASPDYLIAEPVGSCTDLVATVVTPLSLYHQGLVELAAYLVLVDAPRLVGEYAELNLSQPITPREVLVSHQIAEANRLVLSKTDAVSDADVETARRTLQALNEDAEILSCSARTGDGLEEILSDVESGRPVTVPAAVDIDYEVYAAAEAEMGWYNGRADLVAVADAFDPEAIAFDLAMQIGEELGGALIHGKILVTTETGSIKVSVVGGVLQADVAREGSDTVERAGLTVNLRATVEPNALAETAGEVIRRTTAESATVEHYDHRALIPGTPVPEHRITQGRT